MIVKDDGEIESDSSLGDVSSSSEVESLSDGFHYEGDFLVVRRLMNNHVGEEAQTQRENIFHSRCLILGNLCSMIIDKGSYVNVASERLVKKLALPTFRGEFLVNKQAKVIFTLGGYEDKVVIHDGVTNRFTFVHLGQRVVLKSLSLREVHGDQKKMKVKREVERKTKSKLKKKK
ncbi:hypothetical protein CR513_11221, partial [Mucuna pruriens]